MTDREKDELAVRLTRLEELVTHQAVLIEELSQQSHKDGQTLEKVERSLHMLKERIQQVEDFSITAPDGEKPPHY
ncbi:MAG: SlyX family protein [Parvibaculales bacterium]